MAMSDYAVFLTRGLQLLGCFVEFVLVLMFRCCCRPKLLVGSSAFRLHSQQVRGCECQTRCLRWPRLFGQFFRFDEWSLCRG